MNSITMEINRNSTTCPPRKLRRHVLWPFGSCPQRPSLKVVWLQWVKRRFIKSKTTSCNAPSVLALWSCPPHCACLRKALLLLLQEHSVTLPSLAPPHCSLRDLFFILFFLLFRGECSCFCVILLFLLPFRAALTSCSFWQFDLQFLPGSISFSLFLSNLQLQSLNVSVHMGSTSCKSLVNLLPSFHWWTSWKTHLPVLTPLSHVPAALPEDFPPHCRDFLCSSGHGYLFIALHILSFLGPDLHNLCSNWHFSHSSCSKNNLLHWTL